MFILCEFQFHKGAIRIHHSQLSASSEQNFNSIKVRLEYKMQLLNQV